MCKVCSETYKSIEYLSNPSLFDSQAWVRHSSNPEAKEIRKRNKYYLRVLKTGEK